MTNSLSVVIVNFNTGKLLGECITSIKRSSNVEVIVVDNASADDSIAAVGKFQILLRPRAQDRGANSKFQIIKNKVNIGFAKAVNQGIKAAHGKYILLLNPDTKIKPSAIERMITFAQSTPDAGVVGAQLLNPDGSMQASVFHFPTFWGAIKEFWLGQRGAYLKYTPSGDRPAAVDSVVGAAFLITPQAKERVGDFDERYFMYFEDLDYCRRVKKAGLKVYYLPASRIIHYHGISGRNVNSEKDQWKKLIPSSKIYHGLVGHYFINFVLWSGQKIKSLL